jgi:hypothetical protein
MGKGNFTDVYDRHFDSLDQRQKPTAVRKWVDMIQRNLNFINFVG